MARRWNKQHAAADKRGAQIHREADKRALRHPERLREAKRP
jgi:hypothetical protein